MLKEEPNEASIQPGYNTQTCVLMCKYVSKCFMFKKIQDISDSNAVEGNVFDFFIWKLTLSH